ncbi:MAG TPA: cytochrome b/b6 domain-containing protein [Chromatiales bacterium]|nr:cytochrome b/b6 domain-containing protein [Chromatiales bacterium]
MVDQNEAAGKQHDGMAAAKSWSQPTRLLHLGLVATVTAQLALSLLMESPDEANISALAAATFEAHEVIGMAALLIVLMHWGWSLTNQIDGGLKHLFPWFGSARREVVGDLKALFGGQLPTGGVRGGLPGFVHGLGLLIITAMAATGGVLFFILPESGSFSSTVEFFAESHEVIATFVWLYWGGHGVTAILHHLQGDSVLKDMFKLGRGK